MNMNFPGRLNDGSWKARKKALEAELILQKRQWADEGILGIWSGTQCLT